MKHTSTQKVGIKAAVRKRDGYRCTKCGMTNAAHLRRYKKSLHVHRLVPGSLYSVDGCVTLCFVCHAPEPKRKKGTPDYDGDQKNSKMIALPPELYEQLAEMAKKHRRPLRWEALLAIEYYLDFARSSKLA